MFDSKITVNKVVFEKKQIRRCPFINPRWGKLYIYIYIYTPYVHTLTPTSPTARRPGRPGPRGGRCRGPVCEPGVRGSVML